ncbi:MAG: isoprenylcysteine carboxylmethyltransferase family protein [Candidatus Aminicenantales bacterium]
MSLKPAFEIGVWNAWILQVLFFLTMFIPDFFLDKEERKRSKRMSQIAPFKKTRKILALSTHVIIMPFVFFYSIFLPLKIGTPWLYSGLAIFAVALVISIATIFNAASTLEDRPVTKGIYRISRHPIYLSGFLMYTGMGIACASWVVLLCAVLWIVIWSILVPDEERFLIEKYGDSYREYSMETARWIGIPKAIAHPLPSGRY